jgi:hypothetical protein
MISHGAGPLNVVVIGRVSTPGQDIGNIEAGYLYAEAVLPEIDGIKDGEVVVRRFGEQGSGMLVERETILEASRLIESGWAHLVLMEDVSKSYRNPRWIYAFIQDCVDADVRVIARGDELDTYSDNWEIVLASAAMRHGLHIPDTRRRVRRTSSKGFEDGGMVLRVRFGWRKLTKDEATSGQFGPKGLRMAKIPELTAVFDELRRRVVVERKGGVALADWLQYEGFDGRGIDPGPYVKGGAWSDRVALDLLRDALCYGLRQFPKVRYEPRFKDGKHKRVANDAPPSKLYPELAHMTKEQWEEMNAVLDELGSGNSQPGGPEHPRYRVSRRRSVTPLQHTTCVNCQGFYYPCGANEVKCKNALKHEPDACWNHVTFSCERARVAMIDILLARTDRHPAAKRAMLDAMWDQIQRASGRSNRDRENIEREIADLRNQAERLATAIAAGGNMESLVQKLKVIDKAVKAAEKRLRQSEEDAPASKFPKSQEEFCVDPRQALIELSRTSFEFGDLMRKVFPSFVIQPVQALDSGLVRPRAHLTLDLSALLPPGIADAAAELIVVDLFDPPLHIKHLAAVVKLEEQKRHAKKKHSLDILARELNIGRMTVRRALAYRKLMVAASLDEPYRVLSAAPVMASRWKPRRVRGTRRVA